MHLSVKLCFVVRVARSYEVWEMNGKALYRRTEEERGLDTGLDERQFRSRRDADLRIRWLLDD
ncbi:MAG: hypothetical protein ABIR70_19185 [Bryobacteraceae bacterium]